MPDPTKPPPCRECDGEGRIYSGVEVNEWGVWEHASEEDCLHCNGTGLEPAPDLANNWITRSGGAA